MLVKMEVDDFIQELASDSPAPGGGSVAALSGAMAAGLVSMVIRLTLGKKGYEAAAGLMETSLGAADRLKTGLTAQVDEDTQAFNRVMAAFKLPKGTDGEKAARSVAIQEGFRTAAQVPMAVAQNCLEVLKLARTIAGKANTNAASDLGVAAEAALTGLKGAVLNVRINLPSIKDTAFTQKEQANTVRLLNEADTLNTDIQAIVARIIG